MSNREECAAYFRGHPEWKRCFELMRKKWESYGRAGGSVVLKQAAEEERRAVERVLGKTLSKDKVSFSLQDFEAALQRTRFAPITLKELLDAYFEEEIQTKQERAEQCRNSRQRFWERLIAYFTEKQGNNDDALIWLRTACRQQQYGYSTLMSVWTHSEGEAEIFARHVGEALRQLSDNASTEVPLAVLAAEVTGNPHYFDRGSTGGTLLMSALCSLSASEYPQTAYAWRDMLFQNHIMPDEVSNTVITYGLHLRMDGAAHPAFEGFCEMREPGVLTAFHLKKVLNVYGETDRVYVVENEMVFSCLMENLRETPMTLLCTSGQPRTVALKVLELLAQAHIPIFYSGDIDPEGIRIADRIWQKFPDNVHIWRMGIRDYEKAVSEEIVGGRRLAMLEHVVCPELKGISEYVREKKRAAYQERLLCDLMEDIRESGL